MAAETPANSRNANAYELMLMKLAEDKRRLKQVQSMESKAEVKRKILPEYESWVSGVLEGNLGVQDDVLMTTMVWDIDAGKYVDALKIARYAITHKLSMPDQYKRTTATLIAEEMADAAIKARSSGVGFDVEQLQIADEITAGEDMPDEVRAKLFKAIGYSMASDKTKLAETIEILKRANALHDKVGVKKDIEKLERELKNSTDASSGG
jgi:hypothetical protein